MCIVHCSRLLMVNNCVQLQTQSQLSILSHHSGAPSPTMSRMFALASHSMLLSLHLALMDSLIRQAVTDSASDFCQISIATNRLKSPGDTSVSFLQLYITDGVPLVLWHCWFVVTKSIWPVKNWVMRCSHGYLSGAWCKWFAYGSADATATFSSLCFIKIQNGLTFLVPSYPGCPGKEAVKWVFICILLRALDLHCV